MLSNMTPTITRRDAVSAWVRSGIIDFCLYFELDEKWYYYNAFFLHQGLEKLCKAYEIGKRASEYEGRPEQDALVIIEQMVKKLSHKLEPTLSELVDSKVISMSDWKIGGKDWTQIIGILEKGYEECRYPLPISPVYRSYPMKGKKGLYEDPLPSTDLRDLAYNIARQIIKKIEAEFSIPISRDKTTFNRSIDDGQWERFCRLFFEVKDSGGRG